MWESCDGMHVVTSTGARIPAVFFSNWSPRFEEWSSSLGHQLLACSCRGLLCDRAETSGGGRAWIGGKNKVIPISKLPRLVGLGRMESGWEWLGGVERVTIL